MPRDGFVWRAVDTVMADGGRMEIDYCTKHGLQAAVGICALCVADFGTSGAVHVERATFLPASEVEDVLESAHEFVESVTHWDGQQDDQEEMLRELERMLAPFRPNPERGENDMTAAEAFNADGDFSAHPPVRNPEEEK